MPQDPVMPRPDHLFKPGHVPANKGRTGHKNARSRLASMVFEDVMAHWEEQGPGFLRRLAFHDMPAFASFVAKIMPQRIEVETATPFDHVDEALLSVSMRLAQAIAYLPDDDREMLGMLLDKAEMLASQKKSEADASEEGVGGQSDGNFSGGKGSPLPQIATSDLIQNSASQNRGDAVAGSTTSPQQLFGEARAGDEDVIEGEFSEEDDTP